MKVKKSQGRPINIADIDNSWFTVNLKFKELASAMQEYRLFSLALIKEKQDKKD